MRKFTALGRRSQSLVRHAHCKFSRRPWAHPEGPLFLFACIFFLSSKRIGQQLDIVDDAHGMTDVCPGSREFESQWFALLAISHRCLLY